MKSKFTLLLCVAILFFGEANAQNYKWAIGGGSTSSLMYSTDWEQVTHMCTDANRNIYVTTTMGDDNITADTFYMAHAFNPTCCGATPTPHIFIASYNPDGKIRWGKLLDAQYFSRSYGITYDNAGNVYAIGYLYGNNKHLGYDTVITSTNLTSFIVKYDTSGKFKWIRFIGADDLKTRFNTGFQSAIAVDGLGFIHYYSLIKNGVQLTPTLISTTGTYDLKYDSLANLVDVRKMPTDSTVNILKVVFDWVTNKSYANVASIDPTSGNWNANYVAAYDMSDNQLWADSASHGPGGISDIEYAGKGHIYCTGVGNGLPFYILNDTIYSKYESSDVCVVFCLDTFGHLSWNTKFDGSKWVTVNTLSALSILPNGSIVSVGTIAGEAIYKTDSIITPPKEGYNPVIFIIDSTGKLIKLDQLHGDASYDIGETVTSDQLGNIYIGGYEGDSISAKGIRAYHTNGGETDFFIVKYGYNDGCNLSTEPTPMFSVSGDSTRVPATMTFTYSGVNTPDSVKWIFGDGSTSKSLNPLHTYTDTGVLLVCLTVYGCDSGTYCSYVTTLRPTSVSNVKVFPGLQVYPNPANDRLIIDNIDIGTAVQIFDLVGRQMYATTATENTQMIDVHELQSGVYVLQLTNKTGQKETVRLVKAQ